MSESVFETDEEVDFESMFNSSLAAVENQEGDSGIEEDDEDYGTVSEAEAPVINDPPVKEVEYDNVDDDSDNNASVYAKLEEEDEDDYDSFAEDESDSGDWGAVEEDLPIEEQSSTFEEPEESVEEEIFEEVEDEPISIDRTNSDTVVPYEEETVNIEPVQSADIGVTESDMSGDDILEDEDSEFDSQASGAHNIKSGVDKDVSLETLREAFKVLDAYRSLEEDERNFAAIFMGLEDDTDESDVVSTVMNANPLLFDVFDAIIEAKKLDDTEIAFYVVGLPTSVIEGISFVASEYLQEDMADASKGKKISYARAVVAQVKKLDERALRLVNASNALIKGEVRSEDDILSS